MKYVYHLITIILLCGTGCHAQTRVKMKNENNPLLCNPQTGVCEVKTSSDTTQPVIPVSRQKPVKVIYFTDPICSSCWGIEPQLRKLKLEYGDAIEIEYRMGGLLPDWSYNSGGISKPTDVAPHWDEVSVYYDMPIDGDIWLEDPLPSSYPPSIAFKAAQLQSNDKAIVFLRALRELLFLSKKNITKWEHVESAATVAGLDVTQLKADYEGRAKQLFEDDLKLARQMGVRGFPTLFFANGTGGHKVLYGAVPYANFEAAVVEMYPNAYKANYNTTAQSLFDVYTSLTAKEYAVLSGTPRNQCEAALDKLVAEGLLQKQTTKNGSIWRWIGGK